MKIKTITFFIILVFVSISVIFGYQNKKIGLLDVEKENLNSDTKDTQPNSSLKSIIDLEWPVERQERIDHVITTKGIEYEKFSLTPTGKKDLIITYYQRNFKNEKSNDMALRRHLQGILVFKVINDSIKLIWESKEEYTDPRMAMGVLDLTGDGINEIVVLLDNDQGESVLIYKWNGKDFDFITPYYQYPAYNGKKYPVFGLGGRSGSTETEIVDLDGDNIPEITFPFETFLGLDENSDGIYKKTQRAYKWNGKEYFLWKEQEDKFFHPKPGFYNVLEIIDPIDKKYL